MAWWAYGIGTRIHLPVPTWLATCAAGRPVLISFRDRDPAMTIAAASRVLTRATVSEAGVIRAIVEATGTAGPTTAPPNAVKRPITTATAASIPRPPSTLRSCVERD